MNAKRTNANSRRSHFLGVHTSALCCLVWIITRIPLSIKKYTITLIEVKIVPLCPTISGANKKSSISIKTLFDTAPSDSVARGFNAPCLVTLPLLPVLYWHALMLFFLSFHEYYIKKVPVCITNHYFLLYFCPTNFLFVPVRACMIRNKKTHFLSISFRASAWMRRLFAVSPLASLQSSLYAIRHLRCFITL